MQAVLATGGVVPSDLEIVVARAQLAVAMRDERAASTEAARFARNWYYVADHATQVRAEVAAELATADLSVIEDRELRQVIAYTRAAELDSLQRALACWRGELGA